MDRSAPPVKLIRIPRAPSIDVSSRSGLATAFCAASRARFSPLPVPVPIIARPMPDMIVRTSAKSRLTSPGTRIRSEIPCTACWSTESATRNAAISGVPRSTTESSRWFGMVMSVSTTALSASSPASAWSIRFRPSKVKGLVTTATVRIPRSFASDATTGAAPVPVPPPSPAVMNTMSAPSSRRVICSGSSSAARRPTSGLAPAPRPCVSLAPSCTLTGASEARSAWLSVFAAIRSTPPKVDSTMRLIELPPAPPSPMTLIFAPSRVSSSWNNGRRPRSPSISASLLASASRVPPARRASRFSSPSGLEDFTEPLGHAPRDAHEQAAVARVEGPPGGRPAPRAVDGEPDTGRVDRAPHHVGEPTERRGNADPHRQVENLLGQVGHAFHDRRAAGDDDAGRRRILEPATGQLSRDQREDLLDARLDDLRQDLPGELARLAPADRRHLDRLVFAHERRQRAAVALLQIFGVRDRRAQPDGDVVRDVIATERQDRRVPDGAFAEQRGVGGPAADVDQQHAELLLVSREDSLGRGERLEHDILHGEAGAVDGPHDVLHRRHGARDDVHLHLEPHPRHTERLAHAVLIIDEEGL